MHTYDEVLKLETVDSNLINELYTQGYLDISTLNLETEVSFQPHDKIVITNTLNPSSSALGIVNHNKTSIELVHVKSPVFGVKARNKEQTFLLKLLQDNDIKLQLILGNAGTGKTMITCASALYQVLERKAYKKIVFTKPMYQVGDGKGLGAVPGSIAEKYQPYLINFEHIIKELNVENSFYELLIERGVIEYVPIQLMRGASFKEALIIADEVQSLSLHEMRTLCTRIGEGSKLILMGDLNQRDTKLSINETGLYRLVTSNQIKESKLCSTVQLVKNERSELSSLLDTVLS